ncbi:MAG: hypothetical protein NLN64_04265 [Candidatus Thalassarchaeaceae archaeon]|nr:hypothetical protein [Candidatus Thalassarchaeaceae archaeon]
MEQSVIRLYGIYHADGGIIGELSYVIGKIRGTAHCSLCDITHNKISTKKDWKEFVNNLGAPMELLHLNERSNELIEISDNKTPCIVSEVNNKLEIIITSEELDICKKSVDKFKEILNNKLLII